VNYFEVDPAAVDDERRRVAERTLASACHDLGIGLRPAVRWFSEEDDWDREYVARWGSHFSDGWTIDEPGVLEGRTTFDGDTIVWLRAGAALSEMRITAVHEAAHIAIRAEPGPAWSVPDWRRQEHMAEAYAAAFDYREEGR